MHGGGERSRCGGTAKRGGGRPCAACGGREVVLCAARRFRLLLPLRLLPPAPRRPRARAPVGRPARRPWPTRSVKSRVGASWSHPRRAKTNPPAATRRRVPGVTRRSTGDGPRGKGPLWWLPTAREVEVGAQRRGRGRESAGRAPGGYPGRGAQVSDAGGRAWSAGLVGGVPAGLEVPPPPLSYPEGTEGETAIVVAAAAAAAAAGMAAPG